MRVVVILLLASGCSTVSVRIPEAPLVETSSLAERDAYYEAHKPLGIAGQPNSVNNIGWLNQGRFPMLQLADGTRVVDPSDLTPAVGVGSRTEVAASRVKDLKLFCNSIYTVSTLALVGSVSALLVGPAFAAGGGGGDLGTVVALELGGLAGTVAGAAGIGFAADLADEAEGEKMTAFMMYEPDLRRRLELVRPEEVSLIKKWAQPRPPPTPEVTRPRPPPEDAPLETPFRNPASDPLDPAAIP